MSQTANNHVTPLPVVGTNHSTGSQTGISDLTNGEAIAPTGGTIIGSTAQSDDQSAVGTQLNVGSKTQTNVALGLLDNDQLIGAGIILGDSAQANRQAGAQRQTLSGSKVASALLISSLGNRQIGGNGDAIIIGGTTQASEQGDTTAQSVSQKASNPTIGNSTLTATSVTVSNLDNRQGVAAGSVIGIVGQSNAQAHDGTQHTKQTSAPVITGGHLPVADTVSVAGASNCQTISDGSANCLLIP